MTAAASRAIFETRVGLAEDGPSGNVQPQRILEWMQDAAAHASTLGGYPPDRYVREGFSWFIKEVLLVVDGPIRYGAPIVVETWVSDLRRFRSRREYRVSSAEVVVARGQADWMLLERDPVTGKVRPRRPDGALSAAFPRDPETVLSPGEVPEWGEEPTSAPDLGADTRRVRPTELDRHAHVNHVVYLAWLEDHARQNLGDQRELRAARLDYVLDARLDDTITITGWSDGDRVRQLASRDGKPVLRAVSRRS